MPLDATDENFRTGSHLGDSHLTSFCGEPSAARLSPVAEGFLSVFTRGIGEGDGFLTNAIHLAAAFFVISQLLVILANGDAS